VRTASPPWRKAALAVHVASSVGWLGAVVTYLTIALIAITTPEVAVLRDLTALMERLVWLVIVPFDLLSLASGLVCALVSPWGLLRHYWVSTKLVLNLVTTVFLFGYTLEVGQSARIAARPKPTDAEVQALREPMNVAHAVVALGLLLVTVVLAVYKPRGLTRYGQRKAVDRGRGRLASGASS
jgi:hypothetical protein